MTQDYGGISKEEWNKHRTSIVYNSYYQWVPLYLVFLAVLFYLPRLLWLMVEGGLMEFFGKGTTTRCDWIFVTLLGLLSIGSLRTKRREKRPW